MRVKDIFPKSLLAAVFLTCVLLPASPSEAADAPLREVAEPSSTTRGSVTIEGRALSYTATAGRLVLTDADNNPTAHMFYVAYVGDRSRGAKERPVTFVYNGGPGSSSVWLHMGGLAPVYARTDSPAPTTPAPYDLIANDQSILDRTDLVFLDAVGTGYSRLVKPEYASQYYGIDKDAEAFAQAIRRYLTDNDRWNAPKFLMGESYGSPRSAVLVHKLEASGVPFNGVVLISSILNFGQHASGLDREPVNLVPTYAAAAWYHQKAGAGETLEDHVEAARRFALGDYAAALAKGHHISSDETSRTAARLEQLTGVTAEYWVRSNLRVLAPRFTAELLRYQRRIIGTSDARTIGTGWDAAVERAGADPSGEMSGAYVAGFRRHLAQTLGYRTDLEYIVVDGAMMGRWTWSHQPPGGAPYQYSGANTTVDLAVAMRANEHLKVLSLSGYYDLVTPFFATEWDLAHMNLEPHLKANITERYLEGGHMPYVDRKGLETMRREIVSFYDESLGR
jgi:carboxypeptidase C (cathepsin A)